MRILQIHPFLRSENVVPMLGGNSRWALKLTSYLQRNGHDVAVFPWPEWLWGEPVRFGVTPGVSVLVYAPLAIPERGRLLQNWKVIGGLKRSVRRKSSAWIDLCFLTGFQNTIREFRPQIIHCHYTTPDITEFFGLLNPKVPIILTHSACNPDINLNVFDRIIILREAKKEEHRFPSGYPEGKIRFIDKPGFGTSSLAEDKGQTPPVSFLDHYAMENLRIYSELVSAERPLSS